MKNKVTCVCDLCALGIQQEKTCYVGIKLCFKQGVYTKFRNREAEAKDKALDKACNELNDIHYYDYDSLQTKDDWKEWCESE